MITLSDVSMNFGEKTLFEAVSVTFNKGHRYGMTGPNGSGKSTLMKIITGDMEPMAGHVRIPKRVGILRQDHYEYENDSIRDVVIMGNSALAVALKEKDELLAKGDDLTDDEGVRLGELEVVIAEENGYMAEAEATELLDGLGIPEDIHEEKLSILTGGDKVRVLLAQALFGDPEALLLDEPTNALDIASIRWLEGFLADYKGSLVVISHDRHFLNEVCDSIADIDYETVILYPGNYDDMVGIKAESRGSLELQNAAKQKKISDLQDFVQRFRAGSRASQVKSREKHIQREKKLMADLKRSNIARPFIRFEQVRQSGKIALNVDNLSKRFEDAEICTDFNLSVARGDKIAIVGPNGIGKTSLLRLLLSSDRDTDAKLSAKPDDGSVEWGYEARLGYMPQDHSELIEKSKQTAHAWLWQFAEKADEENIRAMFGRLLFKKEEPFKPVEVLSGGETVRMLLARLMLIEPNILLLDEPTNHLDLEAIRALTEAMRTFPGTILFVTHDRNMVEQVASRIIEMTADGVRELTPEQFSHGEFLVKRKQYQKPGW